MEHPDPEALGFSSTQLLHITSLMNRYVESGKLAGMVTCVARKGGIVYRESFGHQNSESKTPMSLDSIFRIYSMTKPITSMALMMLYEEGKGIEPDFKIAPEIFLPDERTEINRLNNSKLLDSFVKKYKNPKDFARARQSILEQDIRSTGFYRNKSKNIIQASKKIIEYLEKISLDNKLIEKQICY